ncbi:MAG: hypothetical protein WEA28_01635, partial [Xanthobacteraceae bacterium]
KIGIGRLREKYVAKLAGGPDRRAFDVVTGGLGPNSPEFREVARVVASVDTLAGFLRELQARYPEMHAVSSGKAKQPAAGAPATAAPEKAKADPGPTGAIASPDAEQLAAR